MSDVATMERERIIQLLATTEFTSLDHMPSEAAVIIRETAPVYASDPTVPPALDIDKVLHPDGKISPRGRLERRVIWATLNLLKDAGYHPILHCDGDEDVKVKGDLKQCMELTFNLDECRIYFARDPKAKLKDNVGSILIVLGNDGWDAVSDYSWYEKDGEGPGSFKHVLDNFDPETLA